MRSIRQEGRVNQKRRTRAALIAAAIELVETGAVPTIPEVADAAGISRATAYRYFSSQEDMLIQVMLERAMPEIDALVAGWGPGDDAATRLDQLVRAILAVVVVNEASFRAMLRASLDPQASGERVRRGGRLTWLAQALEPARSTLGGAEFDRLIDALTPYLGIETLVALCDIAGRSPEDAIETASWASRQLLDAALDAASRRPKLEA